MESNLDTIDEIELESLDSPQVVLDKGKGRAVDQDDLYSADAEFTNANGAVDDSERGSRPSSADSTETVRSTTSTLDIEPAPHDADYDYEAQWRAESRATIAREYNVDPRDRKSMNILTMVLANGHHHPMNGYSWFKKWSICMFYCILQTYVTLSTTSYLSAIAAIHNEFGHEEQIIILGQSMFLVGNALGPAVLGPLS